MSTCPTGKTSYRNKRAAKHGLRFLRGKGEKQIHYYRCPACKALKQKQAQKDWADRKRQEATDSGGSRLERIKALDRKLDTISEPAQA